MHRYNGIFERLYTEKKFKGITTKQFSSGDFSAPTYFL